MAEDIAKGLLRILEAVADLCLLSVYWLVCSVPLITLVPATAAMYRTAYQVIRKEEGTVSSVYFAFFRKNLRQGILLSLPLLAGIGLLLAYRIWGAQIQAESAVFVAYWAVVALLSVLFCGWAVYVVALFAGFAMRPTAVMAAALRLSVGYPLQTLGCCAALGGAAWLSCAVPLLLLLLPALAVLVCTVLLQPVLAKHETAEAGEKSDPS